MMRDDYHFSMPPMPNRVLHWIDKRPEGQALSAEELLREGDAPEYVLAFAQKVVDQRAEWEAGAKDRPYTHDLMMNRIQLFGGKWISKLAFPLCVEGTFPGEKPEQEVRHVEQVMEAYDSLISEGNEEGCRQLAGSIYEWMELRERADRMLCQAINPSLRPSE
jgi:hypothetical protein